MKKEELIEKIEKQSGYIDVVDAFTLISVFTDEFGEYYTNLNPEEELKFMYLKLKGYNISSVEFEFVEKNCNKCGEYKKASDFTINKMTKDKRSNICRLCSSKSGRIKNMVDSEIEKGLIKTCKRCKIDKRHHEFKYYYYNGVRKRKPNCLSCESEMSSIIENRKTIKS